MDLSNIHPVQRAAFIFIRLVLAGSVLLALISQFRWSAWMLQIPPCSLAASLHSDHYGVVFLCSKFLTSKPTSLQTESGDYRSAEYQHQRPGLTSSFEFVSDNRLVGPGFGFWSPVHPFAWPGFGLRVHHGWIILFAAIPYFGACWCLRRKIVKAMPAQPLEMAGK